MAIKVLPAAFAADRDRLRRFEQEARAAAAISHPNILVVYDVGVFDPSASSESSDSGHKARPSSYLVSELLHGETLAARLQRGPLTVRRALDFVVQILRGLAAAHEAPMVYSAGGDHVEVALHARRVEDILRFRGIVTDDGSRWSRLRGAKANRLGRVLRIRGETAMKAQLCMLGLFVVCWRVPCVVLQAAQMITTVHASPSVESTIAVVDGKRAALVLWRGRPGWTLSAAGLTQDSVQGDNRPPGGFRNSGGGSADGAINVAIQRGAVSLDLSYNSRDGVVLFRGKRLRVPLGTNVILVDGTDRHGGPDIAGFLTIDPGGANTDPRTGSLGPLFGRSSEVVAFLQCDAAVPEPKLPPDSPPGLKEMIMRGMKGSCGGIPR